MGRMTLGLVAAGALFLSACGGSGGTTNVKPTPPIPANLSVYINDQKISVSPQTVGAGPVLFIVTNSGTRTQSLMVQSADASAGTEPLASTGPINPQATAQVKVDFRDQGDYTVATTPTGNEAAQAAPKTIRPAVIHIGSQRPPASNQLLQP